MNLIKLVWIELWNKKTQLISSLMAIVIGIGVIVGIRTINVYSEKAVAVKLDNLGANILVLPQAASIDDYYTSDIDAPTIPMEYVERILTSEIKGVDNLSPKLTRRIDIGGKKYVLTGIQPKNEMASKPLWQNTGFGKELEASCAPSNGENKSNGYEDEKLKRKGVDSLDYSACLLGSQVAKALNLKENDKLKIQDKEFKVAKLLDETGTVDDDRIFVNLKAAQEILGIKDQISAIEIMGCCNAISDGLLGKLRNILPDTRITTINQIVSTQIETNKMMKKTSVIFLIIILFVGSISIGNYMWANVNERKKEIGILRMIGTYKSEIYKILLLKALILGLIGGMLGYALGTIAAYYMGPVFAQIQVAAIPLFIVWAVLISIGISITGSLLPAYFAARFEPFSNMQEE
ncbi:MAG: ABC transporter permease [Bacteroidales bacterium]